MKTRDDETAASCYILTVMLARISAACVVVLILLPFTAPFATCPLGRMVPAPGHVPISSHEQSTLIDRSPPRVVGTRAIAWTAPGGMALLHHTGQPAASSTRSDLPRAEGRSAPTAGRMPLRI
jgi:hypothetical protein